jgi:ABC-type uncharacterized transport system auxiliary subunit
VKIARAWRVVGLGGSVLLGGCISIGLGGDSSAERHLALRDAMTAPPARRAEPLVDALLIQSQPADALADTLSIAYSPQPNEFAFYQLAHWTERPVRLLPRLLQQRLEARGVAGMVGLIGDPMRADWLLVLNVDTIHHDMRNPPGAARLAVTAELFDRRGRVRVAQRRFDASTDCARADSSAAAEAMSRSVAVAFDALSAWLEGELQRAAAAPR